MAETFRHLLPQGTPVRVLNHADYMGWAKTQEFVRHLISMGVYTEATIDLEFIHPAAALRGEILVDAELISRLMEGVPSKLAFGYAAYVALHEGHHLQVHEAGAPQIVGILEQERECADHLDTNYPAISALAEQAEQQSFIIQTVTKRMREGFDQALGG